MGQRVTAAWVHPNNKQELQLVTVKLIVVIFLMKSILNERDKPSTTLHMSGSCGSLKCAHFFYFRISFFGLNYNNFT